MRSLRTLSLAAVAVAAGILSPLSPPAAVATELRLSIVCEIPVGTNAQKNLSATTCDECNEGACFAGIGAVSDNGDVYFYDLPNANIKIVGPTGLRTIPGLDPELSAPADMAVDGTDVYVLVDQFNQPVRFRVFHWTPHSMAWSAIDVLQPPVIGTLPEAMAGRPGVPAMKTVWIYSGPNHSVFLYDRMSQRSYPLVGEDLKVRTVADQLASSCAGMITPDGQTYDPTPGHLELIANAARTAVPVEGLFLGVDKLGRVYTRRSGADGQLSFLAYQNGALLAQTSRPPTRTAKLTRGKLVQVVGAGGGIFEWLPTKDKLVVRKWSVEP